ncbi:hypothetical protein [Rubrobacter aplysinae]|uniref:hypothetical protein n=1 Tax=Rubrobacter aplysinae TaxID=909625 RepID=UPI00064BBD5A|nr:hypothetical protein [Rubrobacter aplysinae]
MTSEPDEGTGETRLFKRLHGGAENVLSYESREKPTDEELETVFAEIKTTIAGRDKFRILLVL